MDTTRYQQVLASPVKTFFALWVPVLFSIIAEPLTGLVDTAFVARLGSAPLAALGVGTVVLSSGLWMFNFLGIGSQTEVSQACGLKNMSKGRSIGSLALFLAGAIGVVLSVLALLFASQIAELMGAEGLVQKYAANYIRIRSFGIPPVLITMTSFGILYGSADMRSPLWIAVVVNGLNIILDAILIFGYGPIPPLGIAGAALATTISQWVGALWSLWRVGNTIGFTGQVAINDVFKLLTIGRDMFLRTGALTLFLLLATRSATQLGSEQGAAHQAVRQVWVFSNLFLDASAITAQSIIGYFYGSGNITSARMVAAHVCRWSLIIGVGLMAAMLIGTDLVAVLLVPPISMVYFAPAWIVSAFLQPIAALAFVTDGIHWGTGDFIYLRNGVLLATLLGALMLMAMDGLAMASLTTIWVVTGVWIIVRAIWGTIRIWPGIGQSPLSRLK